MTPDEIERLPYRPCVGVMLVDAGGRVFVGQRIDNPGPAWQMPQGGIDPGESVEEAALRELGEETGLSPDLVRIEAESPDWVTYDLPHDLVPKIWGGRYKGQKQKWVLMRFLGTDDQVNIATEHPEFSAWRWIAPEALPGVIVPFKRQVYEEVLAQFSDTLRG
ncbi:RNA pyrophosphohydrolase [Rhodosalinus halophilus]|jgi:putative (di)nucleoside polyphosphate hydrolase|uniref:RNA pyrophosphohydrolase n=1 Tax=Rhodosalinus halophilus TaxID=2259333 RepID=A0A365U9W5_9RHOB|nr:RNA pyrophosphohydrolase [Rhodosalinus halophilus]RBI85832.1 RNA pyrophosphohydrolase [Rhodosalinus halophilus]